jgi:hypothetical protein
MSNAVISDGTILTIGGASVAEITEINGISIKSDFADVTTLTSANFFKEKLPTLMEADAVSLKGNYDYTNTTGQAAMLTSMLAKSSLACVVTFPSATGTTWTFTAYVANFKVGDVKVGGPISFEASLQITGKPVLATAASNNVTALTVTTATLYPTFAQGTYSYVGTSTGTGLTFTPTFAAGTCSITNGTATVVTTSTVASGSLALGASGTQTTFTLTVTETGKTAKVYTFVIAKTA